MLQMHNLYDVKNELTCPGDNESLKATPNDTESFSDKYPTLFAMGYFDEEADGRRKMSLKKLQASFLFMVS